MSNPRRGFILIISVLVLSAVIAVIAAAAAFGLAGSQLRGVELDNSSDAKGLAEGCAEAALFKRRNDVTYTGNETLTIGTGTCTIRPIIVGPPLIIETQATANTRVYRLHVEVSNTSTFTISKWQRVAAF